MRELAVQDIANVIAIIDICVKRGAIEGSELSAVGSVRDKLAKYVDDAKQPPTEEDSNEVKASE
jgi:hypothetical protein